MKSLLDIQHDIRNLENTMRHIAQVTRDIDSDIEQLRNSAQNMDVDFSKIEVLAKQIPFCKHPLRELSDEHTCRIYIKMLLNIVRLDTETETNINRLIFIEWLRVQARIDVSLEELFKDCYKITSDSYHDLAEIVHNMYQQFFIVDALIVANICGTANREIYEYIAELCGILGIDREWLRILSSVAHIALCQSFKDINKKDIYPILNHAPLFKCYIENIHKQILESQRVIALEISGEVTNFKWKAGQKQKVKKGDVIALYKGRWNTSELCIEATCSGTLFQFKYNCTRYGVISHKTDDIEWIKEWIKKS